MELIVAWPDWNWRPDRCLMFAHTAQWLDRVQLLTAVPLRPELAARLHPAAEVVYLGAHLKGMAFRRAVRDAAAKLLQERAGHQVALHDLAIARLLPSAPLLREAADVDVRGLVSLYIPTPTAWQTRAWRAERGQRLPWRQELNHARSVAQRLPLEYYASRVADAVTGNSEQIRQDVMRAYGVSAARAHTMPAEVDSDYFAWAPLRTAQPPILLFCGRLYARKGVFDLLAMADRLRAAGLDFRLRLVGHNEVEAGPIAQEIDRLRLRELVETIPFQPRARIRELMQEAAVFVFPSYLEGSPRAVKEAMATGCPAVAYDIPGTRILDPQGEALRLAPLGDVERFTAEVARLLRDPAERARLGAAGQQQMQQTFSVQAVAQQMVALYQQVFAMPPALPARHPWNALGAMVDRFPA